MPTRGWLKWWIRSMRKPEGGTKSASKMDDVVSKRGQLGDDPGRNLRGLVVGVVEDLDLQPVRGIVESAGGADQPLDDVHLVVDRELHRHPRQRIERPDRHRPIPAMAPVK